MKPRDKELKSLLRERPDDLAALVELASFYLERDRFGDAEKWVREGLKRHPASPELLERRAELLLVNHAYDEVPAAIEAAAAAGLPEARACMLRGLFARRMRQTDEALAQFTRVIELEPDHDEALISLASLLIERARWEEAIPHCEHLLKLDAQDGDAHSIYAAALLHSERPDRAKHHAELALKLLPGDDGTAVTYAVALSETTGDREACEWMRDFIDEYPRSAETMRLLGTICEGTGYLGDAIDVSRRLVRLVPDDIDAHLILAKRLLRAGHRDDAIAQARRALAIDADLPEARVFIASVSVGLRRYEEAERHLDAIDARGPTTDSCAVRGQLAMSRNRPEEAAGHHRKAIELAEDNDIAWAGLALAQEELGDRDAALVSLRKAIEIDPNQAIHRMQIVALLEGMGRSDEAAKESAILKTLQEGGEAPDAAG